MKAFALLLLGFLLLAIAPSPSKAAAQKAVWSDKFVDSIGFNTHLHYDTSCYRAGYNSFKKIFLALGARHIREGIIDTSWTPYYDRLNELGRAGVKAQLGADYTASAALIASYPLRVLDSMERYEGPNELDIRKGLSGNWTTILKSFVPLLWNSHNKSYPVVAPSLTSQAAYQALGDISAFVDIGNMHNYFSWRHPGTKGWGGSSAQGVCSIAYNMNITALSSGAKLIMSSETGYTTTHASLPKKTESAIPFDVQTKYELRMFAMQFLMGVERTLHYEFCDFANDPGWFGIVAVNPNNASDITPKPAYWALYNFIRLLSDPGSPMASTSSLNYEVSGAPATLKSLLLQRRQGTFYLLLWLEAEGWRVEVNQTVGHYVSVPAVNVDLRLPGFRDTLASAATAYRFDPASGCLSVATVELVANGSTTWQASSLRVDDSILVLQLDPANKTAWRPPGDVHLCATVPSSSAASLQASAFLQFFSLLA